MILGLDISTSICGYTVLDRSGNVIANDCWDMRNKKKFPCALGKADYCREKLLDLSIQYPIELIYIEQSLSAFRPGFSSANTILKLSQFNGIISWFCWNIFKIVPQYLDARSARKACGITVKRGENAKEVVIKHCLDNEKSFVVEYTKMGNPKPGVSDRADSLIIAKAGWKQCFTKNLTSSEEEPLDLPAEEEVEALTDAAEQECPDTLEQEMPFDKTEE